MCGGIEISGRYTQTGERLKTYFPNPRAALPVRGSEIQEVVLVPWAGGGSRAARSLWAAGQGSRQSRKGDGRSTG